MSTFNSSSESNTPKLGGGNADNNKCGDVAAGATGKKARAAADALSKEQEEEILQTLNQLWSSDKEAISDGLGSLLGGFGSNTSPGLEEERLASAKAELIVENDGVSLITTVMKQNPTDVDILENGFLMLTYLMVWFPGARNKVHQLRGAETVINTMKEHSDHARLQLAGCCFLKCFAHKSNELMQRVVDIDGIPSIVAAMKNHPNNKHIQSGAVRSLCGFCFKKEYVYKAGGFSAMVIALEYHEFDPDTKGNAKDAINALNEYLQRAIQE